jgi:hypothetical protein
MTLRFSEGVKQMKGFLRGLLFGGLALALYWLVFSVCEP